MSPSSLPTRLSRRGLLARVGVLGAALSTGLAGPAGAATSAVGPVDEVLGPAGDLVGPILRDLARETFAGLAAMVIPGEDPYSVQQGEHDDGPGAVAANAHGFLLLNVDRYFPYPDALLRPLARVLADGMDDAGLPPALADLAEDAVRQVDAGLGAVLANDQHVPLSLLFALVLNHLATQADAPAALAGPFASPFANLPIAGKAEALRLLEQEQSDLVALVDADLDEPSRSSLSGLLKFVGNALITFTAFGTFSEFSARDPDSGQVIGRPVGWDLARFTPGEQVPADGWDELRGYWRGRRSADDAPTFPRGPRLLTLEEDPRA